jgi:hypothetical protein
MKMDAMDVMLEVAEVETITSGCKGRKIATTMILHEMSSSLICKSVDSSKAASSSKSVWLRGATRRGYRCCCNWMMRRRRSCVL